MPHPARRSLAAMVICHNEADRIENCLKSLAGWVDEIVVLDSGSDDGTVDIARRYTDRVWVTDWPGYGPQRNRALAKVRSEWVLYIDADECVTPQLREEIDEWLAAPQLDRTLLEIPWRTFLFGGPLRFGRYSTPQKRLFLREGAKFRDHQVHEQVVLPERRSAVLKAKLEHHSWRSYDHLRSKHRLYAELLAHHKYERGERSNMAYAWMRLCTDFLQQYVFRLSLLDGWRGLVISGMLAQYAYWKHAELKAIADRSVTPDGAGAAETPALTATTALPRQ